MRKTVRGALVGAALLPLAVAGPGMAFAGSTGYDEGGSDKKQHSHAGEHEGHDKKHDKKHDSKKGEHKKEEKKAESPLSELPEPIAGAVEMITGAAPELPVG